MKEEKAIRVGDLILSENPETGERGYKEVRRLYLHESSRLIHVFVGNEEIKATPEHPFWVEGKGFVTADALRAGDEVRLCDGSRTNVERTEEEVLEEPVQVYNFEVADWHTYYVSGTGVLVHNSCGVNGGSGSKQVTGQSQMQKQVERGQAPKEVDRVDKPHVEGQQPYIHFGDGTSLNQDGSIHDAHRGTPNVSNKVKKWLEKNGWRVND